MPQFPHLKLSQTIDGLYKARVGGGEKEISPETLANLENRKGHADGLISNVNSLVSEWESSLKKRNEDERPSLPDPEVVPVFLRIDTQEFNIESLKSFGIEIIAEEEDGYIIGASSADFVSLKDKIDKFLKEEGTFKNKAAQLWEINAGFQWRIEQILSEELKAKWDQISDDEMLIVDVGIACYVKTSEYPKIKKDESDTEYNKRLQNWILKKEKQEQERDEIAIVRQTALEELIKGYGGELLSPYIDYEDSYSCRIKISGVGLKDIVLTYQYLFEVVEFDPLIITDAATGEIDNVNPDLIPPDEDAPSVCVIDSGIQENHRLLEPAIEDAFSKSYVPRDTSTADLVDNGGHGTRVAGAILYPSGIPRTGEYKFPCKVRNAKVLGEDKQMSSLLFPPKLMEEIVSDFEGTRIFNMSINTDSSCKTTHMSQWSSAIDKLMFEKDIIFIISAGNLKSESRNIQKPGIKEYHINNIPYPNYLLENACRIANPAQSSFALTVGSVCIEKFEDADKESFGSKDFPSSFSRTGLGMWGAIKPDVVEYGGDFVKEKNNNPNFSNESSISPELVKSTLSGGLGVGQDSVGTSYAAPKVAFIVSQIQKLYPDQNSNLYRALVAQSARLPEHIFNAPSLNDIRHYGYGIPNLKRATVNSENRITLITSDVISAKKAHVYDLQIPAELRRPGNDYDILVEVTLSFMAKPRRTRRRVQSYLSTWLSWASSKFNETHKQFATRVIQNIEGQEVEAEDQNSIKWIIRERKDWGKIKDIKRHDSTLQKSWCIIKSNQLPENFSLAVIGHKGWETDLNQTVPYSLAVSFEALNANINIYEMIRTENRIDLPIEVPEIEARV